MDMLSSGSDSDYQKYWVDWFLSLRGNEYFCEIDEEYILDRFNLTGLSAEVQHYGHALDLITDTLENELDEEVRESVEKSARHLYGLIHARFVITGRGLNKMLEKYKKAEFGRCPRVLCQNQPTIPVGLSDVPYTKGVKLFCSRCQDVYTPKSTRHASVDGAYFGTTFPHMLFMVYPNLAPPVRTIERYEPRIFGFRIHDPNNPQRRQDELRDEQQRRLAQPRSLIAANAATSTMAANTISERPFDSTTTLGAVGASTMAANTISDRPFESTTTLGAAGAPTV